jgi:AcrR family transcriptional regulator
MSASLRGATSVRGADARHRILCAAARLYALHGFDGTSIREIAAAAEVTKPLVHYHFGTKEQLFATLLRESIDACRAASLDVRGQSATACDRLRAMLHWQFACAREAPEILVFAHEVMSLPGLLPVGFDYKAECKALCADWAQIVEDGRRSGEFRAVDPQTVVAIAVATANHFAGAVLSGELATIPAGIEEELFALIVHGVAAPLEASDVQRRAGAGLGATT